MTTPTVSVVIGAYNAAPWIQATVDSALAQTIDDLEVIVVDDGSTDATPQILETYGDAIRVVIQENRGPAAARNRGIAEARGMYVAFLDHDDLWLPDKTARQLAALREAPDAVWCYTDAAWFDSASGQTTHLASQFAPPHQGDVLLPLFGGNFLTFASTLVQRDVLNEVGAFDTSPGVRNLDDWDLWLRIAERYPLVYVDAPLVRYRVHATQATQTMDLQQALLNRHAVLRAARDRTPERLRAAYPEAAARMDVSIARHMLNREARPEARRLLARALVRHPLNRSAWIFLTATFLPRPVLRVLGRLRHTDMPSTHEHSPT
jgi:glycosyltransferase involved in cell wall biosynthesis